MRGSNRAPPVRIAEIKAGISSYVPAHDGDAPVAGGCRPVCDRAVARAREPINDSSVPRRGSGNEGASIGCTGFSAQRSAALQTTRFTTCIPSAALNRLRRNGDRCSLTLQMGTNIGAVGRTNGVVGLITTFLPTRRLPSLRWIERSRLARDRAMHGPRRVEMDVVAIAK